MIFMVNLLFLNDDFSSVYDFYTFMSRWNFFP